MRNEALVALVLTCSPCAFAGAPQDGWSQFRGPSGRGLAADEASYPVEFGPDTGLLWKVPVGAGNSSPCLFGERLYLTAHTDGELETLAFNVESGALLWRRALSVRHTERVHDVNSLASPTTVADEHGVVALFGGFGLVAYDHAGEERWRRELPAPDNTFGSAASPILAEGRLLLVHDSNAESFVESIDPLSGETQWRTERPEFGAAWSTPAVWTNRGTPELLVYGVWWLKAYDLADGAERWGVPGLTDEPIVTPASGEGLVFVTSYNMKTNAEVLGLPSFDELLAAHDADGDGQLNREEAATNESVLSRFDADGEGDHPLRIFERFLDANRNGDIERDEWPKLEQWVDGFAHANALMAIRPGGPETESEIVWQHGRGVPECPSPLYRDGRIYTVKNGGIASCYAAASGELLWQERIDARGPVYASPVSADGKLYLASARGQVTVLRAADELEVLARNDLGARIVATPALRDGTIYVRTSEHLFAFAEWNTVSHTGLSPFDNQVCDTVFRARCGTAARWCRGIRSVDRGPGRAPRTG